MSQILRREVSEARVSGVQPYLTLLPFHSPARVGMRGLLEVGGVWDGSWL